ncbi:MAG: class I SAM-dependent methyltransferase [Bryobacteraceae bacterium]
MQYQQISLDQPLFDSFLDRIELDSSGLIRLVGWSKLAGKGFEPVPSIRLNDIDIPLLQTYRISRPDVEATEEVEIEQAGVVCEFMTPDSLYGQTARALSLTCGKHVALQFQIDLSFVEPHYRVLLDSQTVYKRADIYGAGPPNAAIHPDVWKLARKLPGPVLDFGCGGGALLSAFASSGTVCRGLELADSPASAAVPASLRHLVTFYEGGFPSPIESNSARTVFCSEVLEHIPDYEAAIRDMARIASERVVITVPDCSAIVLGSRHQLIPWHLLEKTHVNFFNQSSLEQSLRPFFREVSFGRVCACPLNDTYFYVSIVAYCRK